MEFSRSASLKICVNVTICPIQSHSKVIGFIVNRDGNAALGIRLENLCGSLHVERYSKHIDRRSESTEKMEIWVGMHAWNVE